MTPLIKQDLLHQSQQLPKIDFLNHELNIQGAYNTGKWEEVDRYCIFVHQLHTELKPNKSLIDKIRSKVAHYTRKVIDALREAYNRLKQIELR